MSELLALLQEVAPGLAAAAAIAAVMLLDFSLPWRAPQPGLMAIGGALGVGLGFFAGCWILGLQPVWPPREDRDRFLLVLLPAVVLAELLAAPPGLPRLGAWLLRIAVAALAARVLLHNSTYLEDLAGPGTAQWSSYQAWTNFAGLAALLLMVWGLLSWLVRQTPGRAVPFALGLTCAAAGLTIMLSGSITAGRPALVLASALLGAGVVSFVIRTPHLEGVLGVGLVGLYATLISGHFFSDLTDLHALALFCAPLLCLLPALPGIRRAPTLLRGPAQVLLVVIPLALVVNQAYEEFEKSNRKPESSSGSEYSPDDYKSPVGSNSGPVADPPSVSSSTEPEAP